MEIERVKKHYNDYPETDRLDSPHGQLELIRTKEIIGRYLSETPLEILDVGGGTGRYSFWLAELGHKVWLLEPSERQIEIAREENKSSEHKLQDIILGHAGEIDFDESKFDIVLNLGPMYHLQKPSQREEVLKKIYKVLKHKGILFSAYISRFAALCDGYKKGYIGDSKYKKLVKENLKTGKHSPTDSEYFTSAYLHHPEEIEPELKNAGFRDNRVLAVEGFFSILTNLDDYISDKNEKENILEFLSKIEEEKTLIGASNHLLSISRKK